MKTPIELLRDICVGTVEKQQVLDQAIAALDNPLGVLPGDEIEVRDAFDAPWYITELVRYDLGTGKWVTGDGGCYEARLPQPKAKVKTLTPDNVQILRQVSQGLTSLHDQLANILEED